MRILLNGAPVRSLKSALNWEVRRRFSTHRAFDIASGFYPQGGVVMHLVECKDDPLLATEKPIHAS